jgi:G3E family GTPase
MEVDDEDAMDEDECDNYSDISASSDTNMHEDNDTDIGSLTKDEDRVSEIEESLSPPTDEIILANKSGDRLFKRLFRSKGEFYLATRPHRAGDWSQAGAMLTLTGGRPWFCTLPEGEYLTGEPDVDALVIHDIEKGGEWGDRRQELVFIGEDLDINGLQTTLDKCLLDDEEWEEWQEIMRNEEWDLTRKREELENVFEDGFPNWQEDESEDHDHSH